MQASQSFTCPTGTPTNAVKFPIERDGFLNISSASPDLVVEVFDKNLHGQAQAGTPLDTIRGWPVYKGDHVRLLPRNNGTVPQDYRVWFSKTAS